MRVKHLSAGFSDERRNLYECVLPAVRSKCAKIGYELHVVDLLGDNQPQQLQLQEYGHSDATVRLAELRRQNRVGHVVSVVFVDDSLGPPVLPHVMTRYDFELARTKAPDAGRLIEKWYTLDAQKNHYELRNEMMFETTFETQVTARFIPASSRSPATWVTYAYYSLLVFRKPTKNCGTTRKSNCRSH